ncbi:unnamed protein product [Diabrotica balteata]|uniref:SWIM-type domain-containing protein n=1 Tax=Diabrotica balteata TaxID=107213 RepID=A0A9N9T6Y3_DIABA|nr:unnamed protein product [Diabrotica balteata]
MEEGFQKADSHNLPTVDVTMMSDFLASCKEINQPQSSGTKTSQDKPYFVNAVVNEELEEILEVSCISCVASSGVCKHAIAFLMWLHRRSEEPAPTEVVCYWKKAPLAQVGADEKYIEAIHIGKKIKKHSTTSPNTAGFFEDVLEGIRIGNYPCPLNAHHRDISEVKKLSVHQLMIEFISSDLDQTADSFVNFCNKHVNPDIIQKISELSHTQSEDSLWFELRYGRITASKLYEMAVCKKSSGSLVNQIIGVAKKFDTFATKRGKKLEKAVIMQVRKKNKCKYKNLWFDNFKRIWCYWGIS